MRHRHCASSSPCANPSDLFTGCLCPQSIWPNLTFCYSFNACRVLAAMTAFAWLGWLTICGLLVLGLVAVFGKQRGSDLSSNDDMVQWARGVPSGAPQA